MLRPLMVAVGGDSGTGKTTFCAGLRAIFGADRILEVCLDDYHALDRRQRNAVALTALDPRANNFAAMEEDLWQLAQGAAVSKPVYDHRDGTFSAAEHVAPRAIVVVYGLFPLYTRALRALFDVTVWLDPQFDLKVAWKVQRDVSQRGYSEDQVRAEIERRRPDVEAHVEPQRRHADMIIRFSCQDPSTDNAQLDAAIIKSGRFQPLDYSEIASRSIHLRQVTGGKGPFPATMIELDGTIPPEIALGIQEKIWDRIGTRYRSARPVLGIFRDARGERSSATLAIAQLLIARRVCLVADQVAPDALI